MTRVKAVPSSIDPATDPTSLGESLAPGCGITISDAVAILTKHQESIRQRIPRKVPNGAAINQKLRDLDRMLVRFQFTRADLVLIEKEVERAYTAHEIESERRARYANKWIKP
jgi:hypothetical protein